MKLSKSWWILVLISLGVMIPFAAPYFTLDPARSRISVTYGTWQFPLLVIHIGTALIALCSGFAQFVRQIRAARLQLHRFLGRLYVGSVFISALTAIALFFYETNYVKAMSFLTLAILWLFTSWKGYRAAVHRKYVEHRKWMIRSFAVTLVAVSARLMVPVLLLTYLMFQHFSLPGGRTAMIEAVLNVNIWAGIALNMVIAEWVLLRFNK